MKTQLKADLMLALVTLCWGVSYFLMNIALTDMGPFTLNALRFSGAFLVAALLSFPKIRTVNKATLKYSAIIGLALMFVYIGSTNAVKYTTLSNAGLLCGTTVMFVPLFELIFLRKRPQKKIVMAVTMCLIGIALLTLKDDFSINLANLKGDMFGILCAVSYAVDLILTEKAVSREDVNAFQLGVFQLGATGIYMTFLAMNFEHLHLPTNGTVWGAVIFLSVFSTGVAFIVQTIAQQFTTASHVGIIFTLEPVFAALTAFIFAGEILTLKSYTGALILVAALFITEIDFKKLMKERR